jgi:hypothetical protein
MERMNQILAPRMSGLSLGRREGRKNILEQILSVLKEGNIADAM